ncbi:MAG TPA: Wzz/FepE/Etk N-terminal domain-containing protein [Caulobacteraceae bacterium]|nr:Wzz/FepE/Etk N-terminal domain-containing protein [Caulobacteraceae bacterium]
MTSQGVFPARSAPRFTAQRDGDWQVRPRYALADVPTLLWRERWLMLATFVVTALTGIAFAFTLKTNYPAHSSVLVKLGQEYVYQPRSGDAGRGAVPDNDQILQSESEIMASDALKVRVVRRLGVARIAPDQASAYANASAEGRDLIVAKLAQGIGRGLKIDTAPALPVIRLTYENHDPQLAAQILNTLLEEYLVYRRSVLLTPTAGALDDQRRAFAQRLAEADGAYQSFLASNRIGDFEADKSALSQLAAQIEQQQYANDTALKEKTARLAAIDGELADVAPEVALYHDSDPTAPAKLADLRVQREQLLARYKPDAQPVRDMDAQIARLEGAIAAGRTTTRGPERTGLNPVYQTFQTEKLQLSAELAGLRQTAAALADEMGQLTERRLRLAQLEPQYQALSLDRDALQTNVKDLTAKAEETEASQQIAAATNDNIRIVERATPPTEGKSLRKPVLALALAFAVFSAFCIGLLRMFLRPGLPTPASAGRTLDLPVLGAAPLKQPA